MRASGLEPKRMTEIYPDVMSRPSAVLVTSKLGAAPSLEITRPLVLYPAPSGNVDARRMTDRAARIYETCSFAGADE